MRFKVIEVWGEDEHKHVELGYFIKDLHDDEIVAGPFISGNEADEFALHLARTLHE